MAYLSLIYETHVVFREPSSYVLMVLVSSLHYLDSSTIEQSL
jgi:hypothetical protein